MCDCGGTVSVSSVWFSPWFTSCLGYNVYHLCLILSTIHHFWDVWLWRYNVCQLCLILSMIHHVWDTVSIISVWFSPWYIMSEIQCLSSLSDSLHDTSCLRYNVYLLCLILSTMHHVWDTVSISTVWFSAMELGLVQPKSHWFFRPRRTNSLIVLGCSGKECIALQSTVSYAVFAC